MTRFQPNLNLSIIGGFKKGSFSGKVNYLFSRINLLWSCNSIGTAPLTVQFSMWILNLNSSHPKNKTPMKAFFGPKDVPFMHGFAISGSVARRSLTKVNNDITFVVAAKDLQEADSNFWLFAVSKRFYRFVNYQNTARSLLLRSHPIIVLGFWWAGLFSLSSTGFSSSNQKAAVMAWLKVHQKEIELRWKCRKHLSATNAPFFCHMLLKTRFILKLNVTSLTGTASSTPVRRVF